MRQQLAQSVRLTEHDEAVAKLLNALETALDYARHSDVCNVGVGQNCRCGWTAERAAIAASFNTVDCYDERPHRDHLVNMSAANVSSWWCPGVDQEDS
jgi:hypothetical protein